MVRFPAGHRRSRFRDRRYVSQLHPVSLLGRVGGCGRYRKGKGPDPPGMALEPAERTPASYTTLVGLAGPCCFPWKKRLVVH